MRIGILKTGGPGAALEPVVGSYPAMMRTAFGDAYTYSEFDVVAGQLPKAGEADAYMITGSAASAYNTDAWIDHLKDWLRALDPKTPQVGICFGHQVMAQAYGGNVEKAKQGFAMGLHSYDIVANEPWLDGERRITLPVSHYDQVVTLPPTARVVATSDFCANAALAYADRRAISFQAHPEFALDYTGMLIDVREKKGIIDAAQAKAAHDSMRRPDDRARVVGWIKKFLG